MKSFIVFDIMSASIRGGGSMSDGQGTSAPERKGICVSVSACLRAHQGAWRRLGVCCVIRKSLAGVQRR